MYRRRSSPLISPMLSCLLHCDKKSAGPGRGEGKTLRCAFGSLRAQRAARVKSCRHPWCSARNEDACARAALLRPRTRSASVNVGQRARVQPRTRAGARAPGASAVFRDVQKCSVSFRKVQCARRCVDCAKRSQRALASAHRFAMTWVTFREGQRMATVLEHFAWVLLVVAAWAAGGCSSEVSAQPPSHGGGDSSSSLRGPAPRTRVAQNEPNDLSRLRKQHPRLLFTIEDFGRAK